MIKSKYLTDHDCNQTPLGATVPVPHCLDLFSELHLLSGQCVLFCLLCCSLQHHGHSSLIQPST